MKTSVQEYSQLTKKASPGSRKVKNLFMAFFVGGLLCVFGQGLFELFKLLNLDEKTDRMAVSCTLILITAILTGVGIFDKIARHAGAGTIVPITGFANSVVSPALEFQSEGKIMGAGASIFSIAGPVLAYGWALASLYGLIYWIVGLIKGG